MIECRALVNGRRDSVSFVSSCRGVPYIIDDKADQTCNIEAKVTGTEP